MKKLQCLNFSDKNQLFSAKEKRFLYRKDFSVKGAETAKESLEREAKKTTLDPAMGDFLKQDPTERVGHISPSEIRLEGKSNEAKVDKTASELDDFIDAVANRIGGGDGVKSLFERDLIASYQANGGLNTLKSRLGDNMTKAHIQLDNGHIHVYAEGNDGGMYSIIEFPIKSEIRAKLEKRHAKVTSKTSRETGKIANPTNKALERSVKRGATSPTDLAKAIPKPKTKAETLRDIQHKTGLDEAGAKVLLASKERERKYLESLPKPADMIFDTEFMLNLKEREVVLDNEIYQKWSSLDKSDPELFKHITNIDYVEKLIAKPPFGWSLGQLHHALKDGRDSILDFDDLIDEDGLKIGDVSDFVKEYNKMAPRVVEYQIVHKEYVGYQDEVAGYEATIATIEKNIQESKDLPEGHPAKMDAEMIKEFKEMIKTFEAEKKKIEQKMKTLKPELEKVALEYSKLNIGKFEKYNAIIHRGVEIMNALSPKNFRIEKIEKIDRKAKGMARMLEIAKEKPVTGKLYGPYSLQALGGNPSQIDLDDYGIDKQGEKAGISIDKKLFDGWKKGLIESLKDFLIAKYQKDPRYGGRDRFGVERSKIEKMPPHLLLRLVGDIYGYENLVSKGHISKDPKKGLFLHSLPTAIANPKEAKKTPDSKIYKILESITYTGHSLSKENFTYNKDLLREANYENADVLQKAELFLGRIFDKDHIGDKIVGGKGKMSLELADGTHRTVYKNHFSTFMTGEAAFSHAFSEVEEAAALAAAAKGETREKYVKYVIPKMLRLLNAYIKLGNLNAGVIGRKGGVPEFTLRDIATGKITQKQIETAQIGATIEFAQSAELDAMSQISDPMKHKLVRDFLWKHPGLDEEKKANIIKAIEKIDIGTFGVYVQERGPQNISGFGLGYQKSWPLPHGLSISATISGFQQDGKFGGAVGAGIGGTHKLTEGLKFSWGIMAGVGGVKDLGVPFVGGHASLEPKLSDAYDASIGVWGGLDPINLFRVGASVGVKADVMRSYDAERAEKYEQLGIDQLNKFLRGPHSITEKVRAIESNKALGPVIAKMTKAFTQLQEALGRPISKRMREDLTLQTYNIILNHINVHEDANWTPEVINSIGVAVEISPNILTMIKNTIAGIFSINIKGNTYVIPIAKPGGPEINENYLTKEMVAALRERIAKNKRISASSVHIDYRRMTQEGLLVKVPSPDGRSLEYRATYNKESIADLSRKDRSFDTMKDAMNDAHIDFARSGNKGFSMNVLSPAGSKLRKTTLMLNVDPQIQKYVDVIATGGHNFQIRFKRGFEKFGKLFISRQDFQISHRYKGAPRLTKIMIKGDMSSDAMLEEQTKHTHLIKHYGYKMVERGPLNAKNNLYSSLAEYRKATAGSKTEFLHLDERDLSVKDKTELKREKEILRAHRAAYGAELPNEKELAEIRSHQELDSIVTKFYKFIKNPRERAKHPKINRIYQQLENSGAISERSGDQIMMILQEFVTQVLGQRALSKWELPYAKNLVSINRFTDITKHYPVATDTPKQMEKKVKTLQRILQKRKSFFLKTAQKAFATTYIGANKENMQRMMSFMGRRLDRKIASIPNYSFEQVRRGNIGQYIGSLAGKLMNKRHGRVADLDTYGSLPGRGKDLFFAFGIENLPLNETISGTDKLTAKALVARAILEIEHPHNILAEGKEFLMQPLAVQIGIHAAKFFSLKQVEHITKIKNGEPVTPEMQKTLDTFINLVNDIRMVQESLKSNQVMKLKLGPDFKNATILIKGISVKDFFFEKCGNKSWGVSAGVDVFATSEKPPMYVGKRVKGRMKLSTGTQVSYITISLAGAYEKRAPKRRIPGKRLRPSDTNRRSTTQGDTVRTERPAGGGKTGGTEIKGTRGTTTAPGADLPGAADI